MDDLLKDFLIESNENLARLDEEIVELEQNPDDQELLKSIFRTIHTIKGTCGFLALSRLEAVAHVTEDVLGRLRDGELEVRQEVISDILAGVDVIKEILHHLEVHQEEPEGDDTELIERLGRWLEDGDHAGAEATAGAEAGASAEAGGDRTDDAGEDAGDAAGEGSDAPSDAGEAGDGPAAAAAGAGDGADADDGDGGDGESSDGAAGGGDRQSVTESSLRVDVEILDQLMNLVGELVLSRNQLVQLAGEEDDSDFVNPVQQLDRVTSDLQEAVMRTRMQPIGNAWRKLPRTIRDLCAETGKEIDFEMRGEETELDRQVLQAIRDPLTHLIRNAADHGIEDPEERLEAGKPETGKIVLEALHEGGHIVIEVRDDGRGIDPDGVRKKAVERGLVSAAEAEQMSDSRIQQYIFEPGFSTAEEVTKVSGRGVGMDVVRNNLERIGGTIELESEPGEGTTVHLEIPVTLAILSALIVGAGGESFAIPQIDVLELVRIGEDNRERIEEISGTPFYRLRDRLLPLVPLEGVLEMEEAGSFIGRSIVVCHVGRVQFGLVVDQVQDTEEIVVKPLGRMVKDVRLYGGTTILGDGSVIMILDVSAIAGEASVEAKAEEAREAEEEVELRRRREEEEDSTTMLVFEAGRDSPQAIPLALVSRLEEIPLEQIERADDRWVVQYRGAILPLVPASGELEMRASDPRPVVVFSDDDRLMGLAVESIRDIVEEPLEIETRSETPGILGTAVIDDTSTEVVDIDHHLRSVRQDWFQVGGGNGGPEENGGRRILLVDDSPFFLNLVGPILRSSDFEVVVSHDGEEALDRLEQDDRYDAIVTDIDMPNVDGFELARRIAEHREWSDTPVLALTGREDVGGKTPEPGDDFDRCLRKFDKQEVLEAVHEAVENGGEQ